MLFAGEKFKAVKDDEQKMLKFYERFVKYEPVNTKELLCKQLEEIAAIVEFNCVSGDADVIEAALKEIPGFEESAAYKTYSAYVSDDDKAAIFAAVDAKEFYSKKELLDFIAEKAVIMALSYSNGWEAVKNILTYNADILSIDFTQCNSLKSPENAYGMLQETVFTSLSEIKSAFDNAVAVVKAQESSASSSSGSSAGSSSGSASGGGNKGTISVKKPSGTYIPQEKPDTTVYIKFNDTDSVPWAVSSIELFAEKGIVNGKTATEFCPNDNVTREEFVKMLVIMAGINTDNAEASFDDVNKNDWCYKYVAAAVNKGIVTGKSNNIFGAGEAVSREDAATMVYRATEKLWSITASADEYAFADDADIADYAKQAIRTMQSLKIVSGYENGNFMPKSNITRAEAVVMLHRLLNCLS